MLITKFISSVKCIKKNKHRNTCKSGMFESDIFFFNYLFGNMVAVVFQNTFHSEMYQNNIFYLKNYF